MQGHRGEDCTKYTIKTPYKCGEQNGKWADGCKGEGIGRSKLGWIYMGAGAQLGIGVKLTIGFPLGVYWDDWDN
jgi:hypothetical protein